MSNLLFLLYYQCKNPSIIVRQHDQGASIKINKIHENKIHIKTDTEMVYHAVNGH